MAAREQEESERGGARPELPEQVLIRRSQAGDEEAFADLFDRYVGVLEAWVERRLPTRLRRRASVSDVLQETRIAALRRCLDFENRGEGSFKAWLFKIADHKLRDTLRAHLRTAKRAAARELSRGERAATGEFVASLPSPSEGAMANELRERLRRVLAAMSADYREVLVLARLEQLPLREVAERMGRSREATKKLYGRALSRFAELYEAMHE